MLKMVNRNHLVEYYPKVETLPPMIAENVPMDRRHDVFVMKDSWNNKFRN